MSWGSKYLILPLVAVFAACTPKIATSFWVIGSPADSVRTGYKVIHAEGKTRHCYPLREWQADPNIDTYHQLHHHGVAVESELMAYRIYFDRKQTIDPYCKRSPQMELAQSHWYPNDTLLAQGFGDDILRVSGTVGVGSVKYWNGAKQVHIEPVAQRSQRIVRQTRSSATIEVAVQDWQTEGKSVDMQVQYTLKAGHRDMRCDVALSQPIGNLCTGVQTIPAKGVNDQSALLNIQLPNGVLLASFGTDWPVNDSIKYPKETVGLAVFIPQRYAGQMVQDKSNNLCLLTYQDGCHFYLTCCGVTKENHPVATSATEWFDYVRLWAKDLK